MYTNRVFCLQAYSVYDEEIGYCQGQSFLAAVLLLHVSINHLYYYNSIFTIQILQFKYYTHTHPPPPQMASSCQNTKNNKKTIDEHTYQVLIA